jgi:hypothetical protein
MESNQLGPLSDLCLASRANQRFQTLGMDSPQYCRDSRHYAACQDKITYEFNSRGFRDQEWPEDLASAIWCVGDSYTVGIGQPLQDIWCQQLSQLLKQRTINISMDGASNAWISRRAAQILREIAPGIMILHWSFLHRREDPRADVSDELRRIWHQRDSDDLAEFQRCVCAVENANQHTVIIHSTIPGFSPNPVIRQAFLRRLVGRRALPDLQQLDYGRDGYHYGPATVRHLINHVSNTLPLQL